MEDYHKAITAYPRAHMHHDLLPKLNLRDEVWKYEGHDYRAVRLVAVGEGYVVSGSGDSTVRCLDLKTGEEQTGQVPHDAPASVDKAWSTS
eukprot:COSAG02_NODE_8169_length_2679_cov_3.563178_1_plen_91_part_00